MQQSEYLIIGAVLLDGTLIGKLQRQLPEKAFSDPKARKMYEAAIKLSEEGVDISVPSLLAVLGNEYAETIGEIARNAVTTGIKYHIDLVRNRYTLDLLQQFSNYVASIATATNPALSIKDAIDSVSGELYAIVSSADPSSGARRFDEVKKDVIASLEKRRMNGPDIISTHIGAIDSVLMGGFEPIDLVVIGGRSSMGKTKLALKMAKTMASHGKRIGYLTAEMNDLQVAERALQAHIGATKMAMRYPNNLSEEDYIKMLQGISDLSLPTLLIDDTPGLTPQYIYSTIKQMQSKLGGLDVLFIDYLQQITIKRRPGETEAASIEKFVYWLKNLTKELEICIVLLSQLSRSADGRHDKRPVPSDLRNSGGIEQAADKIGFVYRDEVYNPDTETPNILELIWRKDRTGVGIGTSYLYNNPATGELSSLDMDNAAVNEVEF